MDMSELRPQLKHNHKIALPDAEILLVNALGSLIAFYLLYAWWTRTKEVLTHVTAFSLAWGTNILASQLISPEIWYPRATTLLIMYVAWWAFLAGSLAAFLALPKRNPRPANMSNQMAKLLLAGLLLVQLACLAYEIRALGLREATQLVSNLAAARNQGEMLSLELPPILRHFRWGFVYYIPISFLLWSRRSIGSAFLCLVIAFSFISALMHFTRAPLLLASLTALVCWGAFRRRAQLFNLAVGVFAVSVMTIMVITMQQSISENQRQNAYDSLAPSISAYIGGSVAAYESILDDEFERTPGWYSCDFINLPLYKLGILQDYPSLVRPYYNGYVQTNLYTFLDAFTLDFGVLGAIIGSAIFGFFSGSLYRFLRNDLNLFSLATYCYIVYACGMSFANNEITRFGFLQTVLVAWLCFLVLSGAPKFVIARPHVDTVKP